MCITSMYKHIKLNEWYFVEEADSRRFYVYDIDYGLIGKYHSVDFILYNDWLALEREKQMKSIIDD
jgi:hypothetical protein